jgi:hypothetical protein
VIPIPDLDAWIAEHPGRHRPRKPDDISYTRHLTMRNNAMLAGGKHPATGLPLLGADKHPYDGARCGNCLHLAGHSHDRTWYKCGLTNWTFGAKTDIRLKWPACVKWERDDGASNA